MVEQWGTRPRIRHTKSGVEATLSAPFEERARVGLIYDVMDLGERGPKSVQPRSARLDDTSLQPATMPIPRIPGHCSAN